MTRTYELTTHGIWINIVNPRAKTWRDRKAGVLPPGALVRSVITEEHRQAGQPVIAWLFDASEDGGSTWYRACTYKNPMPLLAPHSPKGVSLC